MSSYHMSPFQEEDSSKTLDQDPDQDPGQDLDLDLDLDQAADLYRGASGLQTDVFRKVSAQVLDPDPGPAFLIICDAFQTKDQTQTYA